PLHPTLFPYTTLFRSTGRRQHNGKLRLHLEVPGMELNTGLELRDALIKRAHAHAQTGVFEQVGKCGRTEQTPVLTKLDEPGQSTDRKSTRLNSSHLVI